MKVFFYCQHVLGVGHFFRALEICKALKSHDVVLVTGGAPVDALMPEHVREITLPSIMMDEDFKALLIPGKKDDKKKDIEEIKKERQQLLWDSFKKERPDILIVELYPFGRKAFRFELDPVLNGIKDKSLPHCRVVCSLRDILVEKDDVKSYENRVLKSLNNYFDALLVHSDPELLKLDATFSGIDRIEIPVRYTGFVAPMPESDAGSTIRKEHGIRSHQKLVIASAGSGSVGSKLLIKTVQAFKKLDKERNVLHVFTGPFADDKTFSFLTSFSSENIRVSRFTSQFLNYLAGADLSISMAGYNTCMNIMAANVPSLVWPFAQNREQRLRAELLSKKGNMKILSDKELEPDILAELMKDFLAIKSVRNHDINMNGANATAEFISKLGEQGSAS